MAASKGMAKAKGKGNKKPSNFNARGVNSKMYASK